MARKYYKLKVAGFERDLPLCPLNDKLQIAAFVIFGDTALTCACAQALSDVAPPHDVMITAESKGIPLIHEMARLEGMKRYVLARKSVKLYMTDVHKTQVNSITTSGMQTLYLSGSDVEYLRGKRVLIVDDVISTGESLHAMEELVKDAQGTVVGRMAILAEGDAIARKDIQYLAPLPLFDREGNEV